MGVGHPGHREQPDSWLAPPRLVPDCRVASAAQAPCPVHIRLLPTLLWAHGLPRKPPANSEGLVCSDSKCLTWDSATPFSVRPLDTLASVQGFCTALSSCRQCDLSTAGRHAGCRDGVIIPGQAEQEGGSNRVCPSGNSTRKPCCTCCFILIPRTALKSNICDFKKVSF